MSFYQFEKKMDIDEGVRAFRRNTTGAVLLDVRTESEFASGYIPGAINVPLQEIEEVIECVPGKNTLLYVYCRSGVRSAQAVEALRYMGYGNVVDIGGIIHYQGELVK
ncbi:MAG: rhodanese-like domain-containing protein [Clostridiales bacterium]|nr:rhodanese-like domain-containing protein [Clostridiales bacterium]